MLLIVVVGLLGAGVSFFALCPYGVLVACVAAPFAGSIAAGLAAVWLGWRSAVRSLRKTPSASSKETTGVSAARPTFRVEAK